MRAKRPRLLRPQRRRVGDTGEAPHDGRQRPAPVGVRSRHGRLQLSDAELERCSRVRSVGAATGDVGFQAQPLPPVSSRVCGSHGGEAGIRACRMQE